MHDIQLRLYGVDFLQKIRIDEIHAQIVGALKEAKFPVRTPEELMAALPQGAATKCKAGDVEITAGDAGKVLKASDFPFKDARQVADVIVKRAGL